MTTAAKRQKTQTEMLRKRNKNCQKRKNDRMGNNPHERTELDRRPQNSSKRPAYPRLWQDAKHESLGGSPVKLNKKQIKKAQYTIPRLCPVKNIQKASTTRVHKNEEQRSPQRHYRNFRPFTRTAHYPHRLIFAIKGKSFQQITRTGR